MWSGGPVLPRRLVRRFYRSPCSSLSSIWSLERKHIRLQLRNGAWVKAHRFYKRPDERSLRSLCAWLAPQKVFMSVLDFLRPELVGRKSKLDRALPVFAGQFVLDIDSPGHLADTCVHGRRICFLCLRRAKWLTIRAAEAIEWYYRDAEIVFSGKRGFHVNVLDFSPRDWTPRKGKSLSRFHSDSRFAFARMLQFQTFKWTRNHFTLSCDPCRVTVMPSTLDARTGLVSIMIGRRQDLERRTIRSIIEDADVMRYLSPSFKVTQRVRTR